MIDLENQSFTYIYHIFFWLSTNASFRLASYL